MIYSRFFRAKRYRSSKLFIGRFFNKSKEKFKDFIQEQLMRYYSQDSISINTNTGIFPIKINCSECDRNFKASKLGEEGSNCSLGYSDTKKGKIERN
jgi:hypothetical protein